ncbi:MAG: OsmC family protein [Bacteroidales bacterium]|nr:OsmC family protein [Bacteroidales bacterium]
MVVTELIKLPWKRHVAFLEKDAKTISKFEITAKGERNEDHPTGFKSILMNVHVNSTDVNEADLDKVVRLAEDRYCPVWAMVKGNVQVLVNYKINIKN